MSRTLEALSGACTQAIKARGLDQYYNLEEDMLAGKADTAAMLRLIQVSAHSVPNTVQP